VCAESQQDNFLDHLILSIFPDEGVARDMDFFTVHFDDSGTAPDQQIALAACYLGTVERGANSTGTGPTQAKRKVLEPFTWLNLQREKSSSKIGA
jgi:allantoicase